MRLNHNAWGITTLQRINAQYAMPYDPVIRFHGTNISNVSALYQAMNISIR